MNQTPEKLPAAALRGASIILVLVIVAAVLFAAGQLLTASLYLMTANNEMALSEFLKGLGFLAVAYILNVLTAFLFTRKWSWRGLQVVLAKPTSPKKKK